MSESQVEPIEIVLEQVWPRLLDVGDEAKPFVGRLTDGSTIDSKAFVGKWLVLDWYSQNSTICREQLPTLIKSFPNWNHAGVEVVSVSADLNASLTHSFRLNNDQPPSLPWSFIEDAVAGPMLSQLYDVQSAPTRFLIDPNGKIVYRGSDLVKLKYKLVDEALLPNESVTITEKHPFASIKPQPGDNNGFTPDSDAAVVLELNRTTIDASKVFPNAQSELELSLSTDQGQVLRTIPLGKRAGYVLSGQSVVDRKRNRVYAITASGVVAVSRRGEMLFTTPLPDVQKIRVDEQTGELWCACGQRDFSWIVVLDPEGNESRRIVLSENDLQYNVSSQTFWSLQSIFPSFRQTTDPTWITIVDRHGEAIREVTTLQVMSSVVDATFDSSGQLWCISTALPKSGERRVVPSQPALWRCDGSKLEEISIDGARPMAIEAAGDVIFVSVAGARNSDGSTTPNHLERFNSNGENLGHIDQSLLSFTVADSGVWCLDKKRVEHLSIDFESLGGFDYTDDNDASGILVRSIQAF